MLTQKTQLSDSNGMSGSTVKINALNHLLIELDCTDVANDMLMDQFL